MLGSTLFIAAGFAGLAASLPAPTSNHKLDNHARNTNTVAVSECTIHKYHELLLHTSMDDFLRAKEARQPPCFDWSDDGCTNAPDDIGEFDFLPLCKRHDFGYRNGKAMDIFDREMVDDQLLADMSDMCEQVDGIGVSRLICHGIADTYYAAVRAFGRKKLAMLAQHNGTVGLAGEVEVEA
jgi:hypothetical protein